MLARGDARGRSVPAGDLPESVVEALIAARDRQFYSHSGATLWPGRALWSNWRQGRIVSGGSTVTMQVATMQVAEQLRGTPPRSIGHKLVEMHLALRLKSRHSKPEILSLWFKRASFGSRVHSVGAAAQRCLGKSARDLTPAEAAYLVGLPRPTTSSSCPARCRRTPAPSTVSQRSMSRPAAAPPQHQAEARHAEDPRGLS